MATQFNLYPTGTAASSAPYLALQKADALFMTPVIQAQLVGLNIFFEHESKVYCVHQLFLTLLETLRSEGRMVGFTLSDVDVLKLICYNIDSGTLSHWNDSSVSEFVKEDLKEPLQLLNKRCRSRDLLIQQDWDDFHKLLTTVEKAMIANGQGDNSYSTSNQS